ncbi:hypothetical protein [Brevundimonas aveniformis]|uniref:hypothetical protein n=1 Tax=Brevundimonas aveniformis TaxID=370977 RepID=UPI002490110F|nr:hypothetical protein [Brevundimonas aveniformis]
MVSVLTDAPERLWATWRGLTGEFGMWRLLGHISRSPGGYSLYGIDLVSTLRETPMARGAFKRLAEVPDETLVHLAELAAVNHSRHQSMWRLAVLFYVSVPVTLVLAGLQGAPDFIGEVLVTAGWGLAAVVGLLTVWILVYFAHQWRSQLIVAVLELIRIERAVVARAEIETPKPRRTGR